MIGLTAQIILASASPRRQQLIRTFGLPVKTIPSDVDETVADDIEPALTVELLSLRKAKNVVHTVRQHVTGRAVIVGSDTVVVADGMKLGKPRHAEEAREMLYRLQDRVHEVYTGVACIDPTDGLHTSVDYEAESFGDSGRYRIKSVFTDGSPGVIVGHAVSKVKFRPMSDEEITAYIRTGEPLDKAGSYGVQGIGAMFIEKIEGDFYTVMGLPLNLLYVLIRRFGIHPWKQSADAMKNML